MADLSSHIDVDIGMMKRLFHIWEPPRQHVRIHRQETRLDTTATGTRANFGSIRPYLPRAVAYAVGAAAFTTLAIGIPTDVIPNEFFTRMTPVRAQDFAFLIVTALLAAILAASYALPQSNTCSIEQGKTTLGGFLSFLAIGCPTCNKLIVLLLGTSGALTIFEPLQPILAALSFLLLGLAIWLRWRPVLQPSHVLSVVAPE